MKILIHETDQDIRKLYKAIFSPFPVKLTFTNEARETCIKANRSNYDLVMLDVEFPTMEGLDIARSMVHNNPEQPLLLVSSIPLRKSDLGASAYHSRSEIMMKPFDIDKLRNMIKKMLKPKPLPEAEEKIPSLGFFQPALVN